MQSMWISLCCGDEERWTHWKDYTAIVYMFECDECVSRCDSNHNYFFEKWSWKTHTHTHTQRHGCQHQWHTFTKQNIQRRWLSFSLFLLVEFFIFFLYIFIHIGSSLSRYVDFFFIIYARCMWSLANECATNGTIRVHTHKRIKETHRTTDFFFVYFLFRNRNIYINVSIFFICVVCVAISIRCALFDVARSRFFIRR